QVVRSWGLHGCILGVTTDQGANIKKAMDLYSKEVAAITWVPCALHKIQLCINSALSQNSVVLAIFQKCKDICA
ncbi:hypothetical protein CPB97_004040, partial [Podila verticillata]